MKSIFIVPTHPPHFHFANELIESFESHNLNSDLMFVFSNEEEKDLFSNKKYKSVVLDKKYSHIDFKKGIIHLKKFYGLTESIKMNYDYASVIDSECRFIKSIDTHKCMKNFCEEKTVCATPVNNPFITRLTVSPFKFFNEEEKQKLIEITNSGISYFWFNNIPIYDLEITKKFFEFLSLDRYISISTDFDFDYVTYMYYALLYHNYNIKMLPENLCISGNDGSSIIEFIGFHNRFVDINTEQEIVNFIKPYWMCKGTKVSHDNVFLQFHRDRKY